MSFDWLEFCRLAKEFEDEVYSGNASGARREALLRVAISRRYYGLFCTARNKASKLGYTITKSVDDHADLVRFLESHSTPQVRGIGHKLGTLRSYRNNADYDDDLPQSLTILAQLAQSMSQTVDAEITSYL